MLKRLHHEVCAQSTTKRRKRLKQARAWSKPEQLEHFVNFLMRADHIQNVAYGSHPYNMDFESEFEVPNWIR